MVHGYKVCVTHKMNQWQNCAIHKIILFSCACVKMRSATYLGDRRVLNLKYPVGSYRYEPCCRFNKEKKLPQSDG